PEQVQQTPREGGRRILGRLVEHMGLRSPRPRRLSERKLPAAIAAMPDYATAIPRRPFPARAFFLDIARYCGRSLQRPRKRKAAIRGNARRPGSLVCFVAFELLAMTG